MDPKNQLDTIVPESNVLLN